MPEQQAKMPRSASPVARAGAGDISERELSRERHNLQTTPARKQPAHPKKQLFSAPVNKFTAKRSAPSPQLMRIRSCLDEYRRQEATARPPKAKAVSMEDLTPTKRIKISSKKTDILPVVRAPGAHGIAEEAAAAAIICRFMLVAAWRRRREDVRCLRKTLESQVSYSERLRMQVSALKSLLDSDNAKVRLAMKELERLKQLLRDKEMEKTLLEREKRALEEDVCAAEDRASEMSIGWRNCRNEAECARAAALGAERALALERAAHTHARDQRDHALHRLAILEEDLEQHEQLLSSTEAEVAALRREADERTNELQLVNDRLREEHESRERCARECAALSARVCAGASETSALRAELQQLREQLQLLQHELHITRQQLDWWPRPLTRMMGLARSWFRYPKTVPEAIVWTFMPKYGGC